MLRRIVPAMGLSGLEPPTSRLSGVRSNRLSYKPFLIWHPPALPCRLQHSTIGRLRLNRRVRDGYGCFPPSDTATLLRLHPSYQTCLRQLPAFAWVTGFGHFRLPWCDGRCVQDPGTYSPRHSDPRLLAIPGIRSGSLPRFPLFTPL